MNIVSVPNEILLKKAEAVKTITPKVRKLVAEMSATLARADDPKGIGLAAPQVGVSLRLFIIKLHANSLLQVFINPQPLSFSDELRDKDNLLEGCLSLPTIWGPVKRHQQIRLRYLDLQGSLREGNFKGLMATTIQHELDHLDGILFTAHVLEQKGRLLRAEKGAKGELVFKEVELG